MTLINGAAPSLGVTGPPAYRRLSRCRARRAESPQTFGDCRIARRYQPPHCYVAHPRAHRPLPARSRQKLFGDRARMLVIWPGMTASRKQRSWPAAPGRRCVVSRPFAAGTPGGEKGVRSTAAGLQFSTSRPNPAPSHLRCELGACYVVAHVNPPHPRCECGIYSRFAIFKHETLCRLDAHLPRGLEEEVGRGLGNPDILESHNSSKETIEACLAK